MINPLDIEKKEFKTSFRGYNKNEVDEFMSEVSLTLGKNINDLDELEKKYKELQKEIEKYKNIEETMSETLMIAKQTGDELVNSAKKKEEILLKETELKIDDKIRQGEIQIISLENSIDKLKLKFESEKIRLRNFLTAQLSLLEEEIPTIDNIKENSTKLLSKKIRAEVIHDKKNKLSNSEQSIPKEDVIHKDRNSINLDDKVFDDLPNLENIKQNI